jgi:protein-tyrosine phosphatase/nicotinamidase-related amidase
MSESLPSILFTQCLQNDFVKPLAKGEPLPNLLHVGREESFRLMGENPADGPVARTMTWAYSQDPARLRIVHLRDWHDPEDALEQTHLAQFGRHCLAGTPGAAFAFPEPDRPANPAQVVNALTLNDFDRTGLADLLAPLADQDLRVGIMGVWTEAKVLFLAYELVTRHPRFQVAVCSALTASSSRSRHFMALDQLERILGVMLIPSMGGFIEFLGGSARDLAHEALVLRRPAIHWRAAHNTQAPDESLLRHLFRDCQSLTLKPLDGGFSGNVVVLAEGEDLYGHRQAPHVVKIGPQDLIGRERTAFERIEPVLGNNAPRVADFADLDGRGAIKYRYASMGGGASITFQKLYTSGLSLDRIKKILDEVFREQLGRLYRAAIREARDLLDYYVFSPDWAPGVRRRVEALVGEAALEPMLSFPGGRLVSNPCLFYEQTLSSLPRRSPRDYYFAFIHGDLNGANIVVDGKQNVWLIDFFHTHQGHVLRDLIKLENDLLFIFTAVSGPADFEEALRLSDILAGVDNLAAPLPDPGDAGLRSPDLVRAYQTLRHLRSYYPELIHETTDPLQFFIGQLRYAVHTLGFDESSEWQRRWALYASARAAMRVTDLYWHGGPLRLDGLNPGQAGGQVSLTILPGRRDRNRSLDADLGVMKDQGVTHVVPLITQAELAAYGVPDLLEAYRAAGFDVHHLAVEDQGVPTKEEMRGLVRWIREAFQKDGRVVIHCVGGLGRSGAAAACLLVSRGFSPNAAVWAVRQARSPRAVESDEQMAFIRDYQP